MRIGSFVATIAGLALGTAIIGYFGFGAVLGTLAALGWGGFAVVLLCRLFVYLLLGSCWWMIEPPPHHHPLAFVWGRLTRDTAADVLPLSQLGGYVLGAPETRPRCRHRHSRVARLAAVGRRLAAPAS